MRIEGFALQLGVELHADVPWVVFQFDDFGEFAVGGHAGEDKACGLQLVAVLDVNLVAVAVAFAYRGAAVDFCDQATAR